ncbi:MAG: hypothetical protein ABIZ04_00560 [Opitutus sp.]
MNTLKRRVGVEHVTVFSETEKGEVYRFRLHEVGCAAAPVEQDVASAVRPSSAKPSRLWWWVVAAFILQLGVWTAWITLASKNKVQEVPLATRSH